jgi:hypothetical protein
VSRTEPLVALQGIFKKGSPVNEGQILFGHTEPRQRPQARSAPARKKYMYHIVYFIDTYV